jgi:hypothetical protein
MIARSERVADDTVRFPPDLLPNGFSPNAANGTALGARFYPTNLTLRAQACD